MHYFWKKAVKITTVLEALLPKDLFIQNAKATAVWRRSRRNGRNKTN